MKERIARFAKEIYGDSISAFERRCGLPKTTIHKMGTGLSTENIVRIIESCPNLNIRWLFGMSDQMLNDQMPKVETKTATGRDMIPLLPFSAVGGYLSDNNNLSFTDTTYSIHFPDFSDRGANCAIRVEGDSMYPRYRNGDVLAIRILRDPTFFQWGRIYVLNTTQGCVVKRLFPDPANGDNIVCRSENRENYPDYTISKTDIIGVAIVVGHAGIE